MDADSTVTVAHGLNYLQIRSVYVVIRDDGNTLYQPLTRGVGSADGIPQGFVSRWASLTYTYFD